jgi:mannose-1-phosphate guanylyltransferase
MNKERDRVEMESGKGLWAIVLAGGEGVRLKGLARRVCGEERPKQYVPLLERRTLLRQTLDRIRLKIEPEQTVVVTVWDHARYQDAVPAGDRKPHFLVQPFSRGTAAGILFPTHWISWRTPGATVAVFPSDHFVGDEAAFMVHIIEVAGWVERHPERIVMVGAHPSGPEVEYGWIEPGEPLGAVRSGSIRAVRRFVEKPSEEVARRCLAGGCVWNTMVVVAKVRALLQLGQERLPDMNERLAHIGAFAGTRLEAWAVRQAFELIPTDNFSRSVLSFCPPALAVSELPPLEWSDLGTPRRVFKLMRDHGLRPWWLARAVSERLITLPQLSSANGIGALLQRCSTRSRAPG